MGNVKIGHASTSNAPAAQQVKIADWYSHPWHSVFRANSNSVANKIADCMVKACNNDNILYSQPSRLTLENQVKSKGYDPSKATKTCYCDCASLVSLCCKYAGVNCGTFTTPKEEGALTGSGKIKKVGTNPGASFGYKRGDILLGSGHTAVVVSTDGKVDSSGDSASATGKTYKFPKYSLSKEKLEAIAKVCKSKDSSIVGTKAVASLYANRLETLSLINRAYKKDIYKYIMANDFQSDVSKIASNTTGLGMIITAGKEIYNSVAKPGDDYIAAVKSVLVDGKRTLPVFVDEFNSFEEIRNVKNGSKQIQTKDRSSYVQDKSVITNNKGTKYKFWSFPAPTSGPFGYTNDQLRQEWSQYTQVDGGGGGGGIPGIDWTKLKPYIVYIDKSTSTKLDYKDLVNNKGVIGGMIEVGKGTKYESFRSSKYYTQVRAMEEADLPYGYVMTSVAKNEREADQEIQNLAFLVRKYPPMFGFWIEFGMKNSKSTNNKIMKIYFRELIRLGLKNKIGIRCTRSELKKITWLDFQEDWYLWLIEHVKKLEEIECLLDPEFFDTDGKSGPIRGAYVGNYNTENGASTGSTTISGGGTVGPNKNEVAACLYAILHAWGIPDVNICGILGNYDGENGINVCGLEGDYYYFPGQAYKWTKDKEKTMKNITPYTRKVMALHHTNSSFYYCKEDGNWWCGIGMTSATGILAYKLVQFSKRIGVNWYTVECTAAYLLAPKSKGGFGSDWLRSWTKPASSAANATHLYHGKCEMPGKSAPSKYVTKGQTWYKNRESLKKRAKKYEQNAQAVVNYVKGGLKGKMSI